LVIAPYVPAIVYINQSLDIIRNSLSIERNRFLLAQEWRSGKIPSSLWKQGSSNNRNDVDSCLRRNDGNLRLSRDDKIKQLSSKNWGFR